MVSIQPGCGLKFDTFLTKESLDPRGTSMVSFMHQLIYSKPTIYSKMNLQISSG